MPSPLLSPVSDKPDLVNNPRRRGGRWLLILALLSLVLIALAVNLAIRHAEPILRTRVIETLSTRFKSKVELDVFHVSMLRGCEVSGTGLRIFGKTDPNNYEPGIQPIIGVGARRGGDHARRPGRFVHVRILEARRDVRPTPGQRGVEPV